MHPASTMCLARGMRRMADTRVNKSHRSQTIVCTTTDLQSLQLVPTRIDKLHAPTLAYPLQIV